MANHVPLQSVDVGKGLATHLAGLSNYWKKLVEGNTITYRETDQIVQYYKFLLKIREDLYQHYIS